MEQTDSEERQAIVECEARIAGDVRAAECAAVLRFLAAGGIGPGRVALLRGAFGELRTALQAAPAEIAEVLRVRVSEAVRILQEAHAANPEEELTRVDACGGRIVTLADPDYPALLRVAPDPPAILVVRGALPSEPELCVAIVGSRRATPYGRIQAARIAGELAARGIVIVSGGARGIDAEAHRAALRAGGRTIAVLAAGLAHPYPSEHAALFDAIVEAGGAVMTEQATDVQPRAELFPRRNRIVAGISVATVVVEAARRSGALVTARIAVEDLSREVGCVPGSVESISSEGCHAAIREGWAHLVTGAEDVVAMLGDARELVQGALDAQISKVARPASEDMHARTTESTTRTQPLSQTQSQSRTHQHTQAQTRTRTQPLRSRSADGCSPQPLRGSQPIDPIQMELPQDAQELFDWITQQVEARESRKSGAASRETRANAAFRAGLDELEHHLGWSIPRLAAATLSLERVGRIVRDPEGAFVLAERYR